jgi:hypothetical protein
MNNSASPGGAPQFGRLCPNLLPRAAGGDRWDEPHGEGRRMIYVPYILKLLRRLNTVTSSGARGSRQTMADRRVQRCDVTLTSRLALPVVYVVCVRSVTDTLICVSCGS